MKRFYKLAEAAPVEGGWQILLDGRAVRTPARALLMLPNPRLADLVAGEWAGQGEDIQPDLMPFTGFANAAIDHVMPDPAGFAARLLDFGDTDTLLYRAEPEEPLAARQAEAWEPLVRWAEQRYDITLRRVAGIMHQPQPDLARSRFQAALQAQHPFVLSPLSIIASLSGSLVVTLAAAEGLHDAGHLFDLANLEEDWQVELWGQDYLAEENRALRLAQFTAAWDFVRAVEG